MVSNHSVGERRSLALRLAVLCAGAYALVGCGGGGTTVFTHDQGSLETPGEAPSDGEYGLYQQAFPPYDEYPDAAWTRVLTLNLHRVFTITQLLTPALEKAGAEGQPARIINIGSVDGLRVPALETFAYSSSKAGLHHLSRVLANHLGRRNIT